MYARILSVHQVSEESCKDVGSCRSERQRNHHSIDVHNHHCGSCLWFWILMLCMWADHGWLRKCNAKMQASPSFHQAANQFFAVWQQPIVVPEPSMSHSVEGSGPCCGLMLFPLPFVSNTPISMPLVLKKATWQILLVEASNKSNTCDRHPTLRLTACPTGCLSSQPFVLYSTKPA